jgi:hypothetical protein
MKERYFVISCSEDGDVSLDILAKDELERRLNENYWGEEPEFLTPTDGVDLRERSGLYIIKGSWASPKAKMAVKEWDAG